MILTHNILQQDKDPWLSMTNFHMECLSDSEQVIEGFEFNSNTESTNYKNNNNNNINLSELPLLSPASPQDFWGPPSIDTTYSEEQIKTPLTNSIIESEDEDIMILNDNIIYDTPPLDFQDEFLKVSKVAESNQKKIIECYASEKPLPTIIEDDIYTKDNDHEMIDDAVFTKVEFSSQDPANMVIYPIISTESQNAPGDTDTIYTIPNVKKEITSVKENNNNVKEIPRVPKLKLKIPKIPSNIYESNVVDTPEIIDQALDLANDFDLIAYISNPENATTFEIVKQEPEDDTTTVAATTPSTSIDSIRPKRKSTVSLEELFTQTPKRRYSTRTRASSPSNSTFSEYINPSSVASNASSDDSYRVARRRGRPAKPVASLLNLNEFAHLSPEDLRYRELRNKNNEASRRSRMNRRTKEQQLEDEAAELTQQYTFMEITVKKLERECAKMRNKVKKMAML